MSAVRQIIIIVAISTILVAHPASATVASCYGTEGGQTRTAQGKPYHPWGKTAAHRTLPFGTRVRITYRGRSIVVPITDRGPYHHEGNRKRAPYDRDFDLSLGACHTLGLSLDQVEADIL